jgi:tight adherence protein C
MNSAWSWFSVVALSVCATATAVLVGRIALSVYTLPSATEQLPWYQGRLLRIARFLAPTFDKWLSARRRTRLQRFLVAHELDASFDAPSWLALRATHGFCFAVSGALCAWLLGVSAYFLAGAAFFVGYGWMGLWCHRRRIERQRAIARDLPAYLDLLTVCVESGATLTAGIRLVVGQAPASALRNYFERVLREVRAGRARAQAFSQVAELYGVSSLSALSTALVHAEHSGMSLGNVLRAQAQQRTAERFARAEKLAMQAPVKLLGPLILCIFPCTFVVLAVPIAVRLMEAFNS